MDWVSSFFEIASLSNWGAQEQWLPLQATTILLTVQSLVVLQRTFTWLGLGGAHKLITVVSGLGFRRPFAISLYPTNKDSLSGTPTEQQRNEQQRTTKIGEILWDTIIQHAYAISGGLPPKCYIYNRLDSSVALLSIVEVASYSYDGYNTNMAAILLHTGSIQTV